MFHIHKWSKWALCRWSIDGSVVDRQKRLCSICNKTKVRDLY